MQHIRLIRTLALVFVALCVHGLKAQGLEEHIHRFQVNGITSSMLEKQCQEALIAHDPEMVVSIDRPNAVVKVKTMHELPLGALILSMEQLGLVVSREDELERTAPGDGPY